MREVDLPISKSIVNRVLILQALHGEPLLDVTGDNTPDDVVLLHDALQRIALVSKGELLTLNLKNCGTAMRFLTAYCAQKEGLLVRLDGCSRMRERPILQLVDALLACGADIRFERKFGYPPLLIQGQTLTPPISETSQHSGLTILNPVSTQFISALLMIGVDVESTARSPYIDMTRSLMSSIEHCRYVTEVSSGKWRDWSSAAFWYEYVALHGGEILLKDLKIDSLQGDSAVKDIYRKLGVETIFTQAGAVIRQVSNGRRWFLFQNFQSCPDLYPAVAITCKQKGIRLLATGIESLQWKESNRVCAVRERKTYHDHRMAMALMAADLPCDDSDCVKKSYPLFTKQLCQLNA